jgi:hypothetical protein
MLKQTRPRGVGTDAAENHTSNRHRTRRSPHTQPHCEVYAVKLVYRFPRHCVLATTNPLAALTRLRDAAWGELGRPAAGRSSSGSALDLLDQIDTCLRCVDRQLASSKVRQLRARLGVAA